MEVKKVQEKREELENKLFELINEFQKETDTRIAYITIKDVYSVGKRFPQITGIEISLEI